MTANRMQTKTASIKAIANGLIKIAIIIDVFSVIDKD
jgi:hypothetical protein